MKDLQSIYNLISDAYAEIDIEKQRLIRCKNSTNNVREQLVYTAMIACHAEDQCKLNTLKHKVELMMLSYIDDDPQQVTMSAVAVLEKKALSSIYGEFHSIYGESNKEV